MPRRSRSWLSAAFLILGGCVLAQSDGGSSIPPEALESIQVGVSTRADVTRVLGPPDEVVYSNHEHDPLFEQAYRYRRARTRQSALFLLLFSTYNSDQKFDHVMFFFDPDGVVEHVGVSLEKDTAEYGAPW